jgi:predicted amidohydrolase YtcJ
MRHPIARLDPRPVLAALILAALGPAAAAQVPAAPADLVLKNATVWTLDARRPSAEAVAVRGNRIVAVGTNAEVAPLVGPATRVLDLAGRTVVPGLKESHGHFLGIGQARMAIGLVGAASYDEIVARVTPAVAAAKPGEWLLGRGWHEEKWTGLPAGAVRGFPTHDALTAVSPQNPVYLVRADGHAALVNAKAMELMGIGPKTQPPAGGEVIKDAAGRPTGILVDRAMGLVKVPPPTPDQLRRAFELAQEEALRKGITAFDDAGVGIDVAALYEELAAEGKLQLRLYVMLRGLESARRFARPKLGLGGGLLTIRAIKLSADGALGSRGAALHEPYADDAGNSGFFTTPPAEILETARFALANGFQLCVHAIGDRANTAVLDAFETALREHPEAKDPRFRNEHSQILDERDIPRFAKLGVIASMQGIHCSSDRPWAAARLGDARVAEGAYVWRKLLASGARIINGTDAPVEDVDPIPSFFASVTREGPDGRPAGGFDPAQRMTREEALRSYTLEGAYGTFTEKDAGSIEPGKLADFTVLSKDILTVPEEEILSAHVTHTIVDGKLRYQR